MSISSGNDVNRVITISPLIGQSMRSRAMAKVIQDALFQCGHVIENIIKAMRYGIPSSGESHPGLIIGIVSHASLVGNCRDFDEMHAFGRGFQTTTSMRC